VQSLLLQQLDCGEELGSHAVFSTSPVVHTPRPPGTSSWHVSSFWQRKVPQDPPPAPPPIPALPPCPPLEVPPLEVPPLEVPPLEVPPLEVPPLEVPPADCPA